MAFTPVRPNDPLDQPSHSGLHNQHSQDIDDIKDQHSQDVAAINAAQLIQDGRLTDLEDFDATLAGGDAGEVLAKSTNDDYDWEWIPAPTGGDGGGDTYPGISTEQPNGLGLGTDGGLQVDPATLLSDAEGQYLTLDDEGKIYSETLPPVSGKNLFINGKFKIWQRGSDHTETTLAGYYTADRWRLNPSGGVGKMKRAVFTQGQTEVPGEPNSFARIEMTTGANNSGLTHRVEDIRSLPAGKATVSFYAKADAPRQHHVYMEQGFGSGGSPLLTTQSQPVHLTTNWQRFVLTFDIPSIAGKSFGPGTYVGFVLGASHTEPFVLDFAVAQLEVGETATAFEEKQVGTELLECKRYYQQLGHGMSGHTQDATMIEVLEKFEVQMRTDPTVNVIPGRQASIRQALAGATDQTAPTPGLIAPSGTKDSLWTIVDGFTGLTGWVSCTSRASGGTAFMEVSAEL